MVRKPEPAPRGKLGTDALEGLNKVTELGATMEVLQRANRDYLYWDRFKHLPMPNGLTAEDVWFLLRLMRRLNSKPTPIADVHGQSFWYALTDELQRCLMVVDQQAGGAVSASASSIPPNTRQRYLLSKLMEEAIASSQLEGAATTRQVAKDMLRSGRQPQSRGERMILNNYRTISRIRDLQNEPVTPELLLRIQESMTEGTLKDDSESGRFRTQDDEIIIGDDRGQVVHIPPPARDLPPELERLCSYANEDGDQFVHPVIKAVLLHFWLAYIHPFCDGNGRTARALFYLYMIKRGYWLFEYVSISSVILHKRTQYERAFLYSEADDADVTYFLTFHLRAIETALGQLWGYIDEKNREDTELRARLIRDQGLNHRQRALLGRAVEDANATFTIESHRASHNVAYATARGDLMELVGQGYLDLRRDGRAYVFSPTSDIRTKLAG